MADFKRAKRVVAEDYKPICAECSQVIKIGDKYLLTAGESICRGCFEPRTAEYDYIYS